MLATTFEELVAAERMADIRRQVAEGRLLSSFKDERTAPKRENVQVFQVAEAISPKTVEEAAGRAA